MSAAQLSKRVGDVFQVLGGGTPTTKNPAYWNGSIPWATSADLDNDLAVTPRKSITKEAIAASATNLVPAGSVIVATRVGLGKVGIAETKLCFSQDCQGLIVDPKICDPKFVAHQLKLRVQIFKHISRGTTIAGVTKKQLLDVPFDLPPLLEQRQIVAEIENQFSRLEEGVGALKRVQANLKRYRAAVLKAACEGQLVPTEAELAKAKKRKYESGAELLARILAERRNNWQGRGKYKEPGASDSANLPQLPEGWACASLGEVCNLITDGTHLKPTYLEHGMPFLSVKNVRPGRITDTNIKYISAAQHAGYVKRCRPEKGDILYTKVGATFGYAAINTLDYDFSIYVSLALLKYPQQFIKPKYIECCMNSPVIYSQAQKRIKGIGRPDLHLEEIRDFYFPLPPLAEQSRIVAEVERRLSVVEELEAVVTANLQRATRLRQSILQKAFTGTLLQSQNSGEKYAANRP